MNEVYTIELTGKEIALLCDCITERINSNDQISKYTNKNLSHKNRSLRGLHRYLRNIKKEKDEINGKRERKDK